MHQKAVEYFRMSLKHDASQNTRRIAYANALGMIDKPTRAEKELRRVLNAEPDNLLAMYNLACALDDQDIMPEALDLWNACLSSTNVAVREKSAAAIAEYAAGDAQK